MIDWLLDIVPLLKGIHITALVVWCGGLLALPLMLERRDPAVTQDDYRRIRQATHLTYTVCVTPAALVAIVVGTWLIFLREIFDPWIFAKLLFVAGLTSAHAWVGHLVVQVGENPERHASRSAILPIALVLVLVLAILYLVLAKPNLGTIDLPEWLQKPQGGQLLFDVPRR